MEQSPFWCLRGAESTSKLAEWVSSEMGLESIICPRHDGHQRPGKRLTNLSVALRGNVVEDFVWTWYSECLIQDHVLELFQKNAITGVEVKPVKAVFKRRTDRVPPRLWEIVVTGWAGMAPPESGIMVKDRCEACNLARYSGCTSLGKLIDISQWDGSDVFMVWPLPKFRFVTDRVAHLIRENRLTGVELRRPEELGDLSRGFGPGRLSYWMPEARARELGEPLGIY